MIDAEEYERWLRRYRARLMRKKARATCLGETINAGAKARAIADALAWIHDHRRKQV